MKHLLQSMEVMILNKNTHEPTLFSILKVICNAENGDSQTDLQMKTHLSYVTIQQVVRHLREIGILSTSRKVTSHGKALIVHNILPEAKQIAKQALFTIETANEYFYSEKANIEQY